MAAKAAAAGEIDVKGAVELLSETRLVREDQLLLETEPAALLRRRTAEAVPHNFDGNPSDGGN
jgi:hypothetical protein